MHSILSDKVAMMIGLHLFQVKNSKDLPRSTSKVSNH